MAKAFLILFSSVLLIVNVACHNRRPNAQIEKSDFDEMEIFNVNQKKWISASSLMAYEFEYREICYCMGNVSKVLVRVDSTGKIESTIYFDIKGDIILQSENFKVYSVDDLFELIRESLEDELGDANVSYDNSLGYPNIINLDKDIRTIDDEILIEVLSFTVL